MPGLARLGFDDVQPEHLNTGTWRKILLSEDVIPGARSCVGYSNFSPGTVTSPIVHETEEFAFVVTGTGEMRGDDEVVRGDSVAHERVSERMAEHGPRPDSSRRTDQRDDRRLPGNHPADLTRGRGNGPRGHQF